MANESTRRLAVSFDVGGTFTDFVVVDPDAGEVVSRHKVLTNAQFPARGAIRGWRALANDGMNAEDVAFAVHSTTLVTNSIIERKGAKAALLTTRGFRDVLELGREQMYDIYDLFAPPPEPIIPRHLRIEVDERMLATGNSLRAPCSDELDRLIEHLRDESIEAIAISFLHSYRNPEHEQVVANYIRERLPDIEVSTSADVAPARRRI